MPKQHHKKIWYTPSLHTKMNKTNNSNCNGTKSKTSDMQAKQLPLPTTWFVNVSFCLWRTRCPDTRQSFQTIQWTKSSGTIAICSFVHSFVDLGDSRPIGLFSNKLTLHHIAMSLFIALPKGIRMAWNKYEETLLKHDETNRFSVSTSQWRITRAHRWCKKFQNASCFDKIVFHLFRN